MVTRQRRSKAQTGGLPQARKRTSEGFSPAIADAINMAAETYSLVMQIQGKSSKKELEAILNKLTHKPNGIMDYLVGESEDLYLLRPASLGFILEVMANSRKGKAAGSDGGTRLRQAIDEVKNGVVAGSETVRCLADAALVTLTDDAKSKFTSIATDNAGGDVALKMVIRDVVQIYRANIGKPGRSRDKKTGEYGPLHRFCRAALVAIGFPELQISDASLDERLKAELRVG